MKARNVVLTGVLPPFTLGALAAPVLAALVCAALASCLPAEKARPREAGAPASRSEVAGEPGPAQSPLGDALETSNAVLPGAAPGQDASTAGPAPFSEFQDTAVLKREADTEGTPGQGALAERALTGGTSAGAGAAPQKASSREVRETAGPREAGERAPGAASSGAAGEPAPTARAFDGAADWVKRLDGPERDAWQLPGEVISLLTIQPGMTVVDLGAGTGYFLRYLSRAVGETGSVLALDTERDMIRHMDERAEEEELLNVKTQLVSPGDPQLPGASVDRVLIVNTWHHIPPDRRAYAEKLERALKSSGAVYVVDFTADSPVGPPKTERLPPEVVAAELRSGGLIPEVIEESLPYQYVVAGRHP